MTAVADWLTESSQVVYETPWIRIRKDEVTTQTGKRLTYSYMELQNPSVFIVATNNTGDILLQNVYRYTIRERIWETPAGFMNEEEEPLAAARRELKEETGLVSDDWSYLGLIRQIVGTGNIPQHVFLARGVRPDGSPTDKEEDIIDCRFVSLADIETMIRGNELVDSAVITAIYMAKLHGIEPLRGHLPPR